MSTVLGVVALWLVLCAIFGSAWVAVLAPERSTRRVGGLLVLTLVVALAGLVIGHVLDVYRGWI